MPYKRKQRYPGTCRVCSAPFEGLHPQRLSCSTVCAKRYEAERTGRIGFADGLPTGTVGALSEMLSSIDLMRRGYSVFRALSPSCFCDLVACKNGEILRVECRTGYKSKSGKLNFPRTIHESADVFSVYVHVEQKIYYLKPDGKTEYDI